MIFPSPTTEFPPLITPDLEDSTVLDETSTILNERLHGTATKLSLINVGAANGVEPNGIRIGFPPFSHILYGIITK